MAGRGEAKRFGKPAAQVEAEERARAERAKDKEAAEKEIEADDFPDQDGRP